LPSTAASWTSARSPSSSPSSLAAISACLADDPVRRLVLRDQAAVEQHPYRLDGVERHALGALEDLLHDGRGQPRNEPAEELDHCPLGERLQVDGRESAPARAPGGPPLRQLRPRERHYEDRVAARPLEQVLDEVEQALVGPLQVLEDHHDRVGVRQPLEEQTPRREELLTLRLLAAAEAE
jgi:hypothetical protein